MTSKTTIPLEGLTLVVEDAGEGTAPWGNETVYKYRVTVSDDATTYETDAWGSIHDYERGERDDDGIGWMVLDELLSAAYDPDEFFSMAVGDENGRQRAQQILDIIAKAEALEEALTRNEEKINAHR